MIASCAHAQTPESRDALLSRATSAKRDGFAKILDETMRRWFTDGFIARGGDAAVRRRLLDDNVAPGPMRSRRWRRSIPRRN